MAYIVIGGRRVDERHYGDDDTRPAVLQVMFRAGTARPATAEDDDLPIGSPNPPRMATPTPADALREVQRLAAFREAEGLPVAPEVLAVPPEMPATVSQEQAVEEATPEAPEPFPEPAPESEPKPKKRRQSED